MAEKEMVIIRLAGIAGGFLSGGFLGFFGGIVWYELVAVPKAVTMDPMCAETYLCSAGNGAPILGVMIGAMTGAIIQLVRQSRVSYPTQL